MTYSVRWSPEDSEYVATAEEFQWLSHLDKDPAAALAGIQELVRLAR
jgi:hypothetical protein